MIVDNLYDLMMKNFCRIQERNGILRKYTFTNLTLKDAFKGIKKKM